MYTGNYECLELFVKPDEGKKGSVLLKNVKESTTETKEPKHIYGNWIKFPVSRNTEYEISTQDCTITFAYLSECENIMENGICVLDTTDNYKEMNKEEFLSVYERQQVWLPCHQEKDFGKTLGNYFRMSGCQRSLTKIQLKSNRIANSFQTY